MQPSAGSGAYVQTAQGGVFLVGLWFALLRIAAIYVASMFCILFVALVPLGSAAILAAIIASSLAYFFLADFLYIGRLTAYLSLADWPLEALVLQACMPLHFRAIRFRQISSLRRWTGTN